MACFFRLRTQNFTFALEFQIDVLKNRQATCLGSTVGKGLMTSVMISCVFVVFPHGVLDQVCYLIISIPDL